MLFSPQNISSLKKCLQLHSAADLACSSTSGCFGSLSTSGSYERSMLSLDTIELAPRCEAHAAYLQTANIPCPLRAKPEFSQACEGPTRFAHGICSKCSQDYPYWVCFSEPFGTLKASSQCDYTDWSNSDGLQAVVCILLCLGSFPRGPGRCTVAEPKRFVAVPDCIVSICGRSQFLSKIIKTHTAEFHQYMLTVLKKNRFFLLSWP